MRDIVPLHLAITASDPDVEKLIHFILCQFPHLSNGEKREMIERTAKWFQVSEEFFFNTECAATSELGLVRDPAVLTS